jgi:hypothetical protein
MALSFEKLLNDAKIMVTRLKDHDNSADIIIAQTQGQDKKFVNSNIFNTRIFQIENRILSWSMMLESF